MNYESRIIFSHYFRVLTQKKQYGEIILPLQAVMEVMQHFNSYMDIPQVKQLSDQVSTPITFLANYKVFSLLMCF
jgi:hypothetical protein